MSLYEWKIYNYIEFVCMLSPMSSKSFTFFSRFFLHWIFQRQLVKLKIAIWTRLVTRRIHQARLLGKRWIIGNTMWIWLSTSSQRRILDLWNKVYQDFGKFNSLRNTLTDSRSNMSLFRACFLRWWATLRHVHIQGQNTTKKTITCNFWYRHLQRLGRYMQSYLLMFQLHIEFVLILILYYHYLTGITNQLA